MKDVQGRTQDARRKASPDAGASPPLNRHGDAQNFREDDCNAQPLHSVASDVKPKRQSGGVAAAARRLAQPIADSLGLILWDVRFFKEGTDWILLLVIDKPRMEEPADGSQQILGVTLNDCEALSRAIDPLLDDSGLIERSYRLQVSSPGLERKLRTPEHFEAYLGEKVYIRLQCAFEGQRQYHGILADFDGTALTLELSDGRGLTCTLAETSWVKADDFY